MIFLVTSRASLQIPNGFIEWFGWLILLGLIIYLLVRGWRYQQPLDRRKKRIFLLLTLLVPITSLLLPGFRFYLGSSTTAIEPPDYLLFQPILLFSTLPWFLAAGFLGPAPAAALAFFSGLLIALWSSHNPFYPLEMAFLAALLGILIHQNYRTLFFRILVHPLIAAFLLILIYPLLYLMDSLLMAGDSLAESLNLTLADISHNIFSVGISILIGGLITEVVAYLKPNGWGSQQSLQPSPAERRLTTRFLYIMTPIALILLVILVVSDWIVAGRAARQMLEGRMGSVGKITAEVITPFLGVGINLIQELAKDPILIEGTGEQITDLFARQIEEIKYFFQLIYLDMEGKPLAGYPPETLYSWDLSLEELEGIKQYASTIPMQIFSLRPPENNRTAYVSFLTGVKDRSGKDLGAIIGRIDLSLNPFSKPLLTSLDSMSDIKGEGILIDEKGLILYHPDPSMIMESSHFEDQSKEAGFLETNPFKDEIPQIVYYAPSEGESWAVMLKVPAQFTEQQAIEIVIPLLVTVAVITLIAVIFFWLGLRVITSSLHNLAVDADRMAQGQFELPLFVRGEDEVGRLRQAFEKMRVSLKARLDELNRLLTVSQGVASTFNIEGSMQPILESAVAIGASSARVILAPAVVPVLEGGIQEVHHFGYGPSSDLYSYLDEQILTQSQKQERIILSNLTHSRIFVFSPGFPRPQALLAIALRNENYFYGTLWVAFEQPHKFPDEEIRYLATLAGQACLAAANARLFLTSEIGRQQLEAILASTPDPVLVTDQLNQLLLANPAAIKIFGPSIESGRGKPIEQIIDQEKLVELLRSSAGEMESAELKLPDGQIYSATASTVQAAERRMGRVCVLRNVTQFKEVDSLKSDFVSTVSHDLRSPLTLIRGYATMLHMVGELNEQQKGYLQKILSGIENMSHLVNNLLDLGRIEAGVGLQLEKQPVDTVINRVFEDFQLHAAQKQVILSKEIPQQNLPVVEADHALLYQALQNLVDNALHYTKPGGEVIIGLKIHPDYVIYQVIDTGAGIAPADLPHIFEKFYRPAGKGVKIERGTGLGLAIVKSIADRHSGQVWVNSQLGVGSEFSLLIPLHQSHPE